VTLTVDVIKSPDDLRNVRDEWRELLDRSRDDLPFSSPEWIEAWWMHLSERGRIGDELAIHLVRSRNRLVGIIPLMATERRIGFLRIRTLSFVGADPYITELRRPIVDPEHGADVARVLARHLEDQEWDWIEWTGLVHGSSFACGLERALPLEWGGALSANVLRLPSSWDAFKAGLKRNIKESLRRCTNSLKREGLSATLDVGDQNALGTFFDLHAQRAKAEGMQTHPNRFASTRTRLFLEDVCARFGDRAIVLMLRVSNAIVAARVAFLVPRGLYLYYSGHDPLYSRFSVATTIVAEAIRYAIDRRLEFVHLSTGTDPSKARWGPVETMHHYAITTHSSARSQGLRKAATLARVARTQYAWIERALPARRVM
jgi:CelD/BcsL family acetyltransferase involved in cellulose biosynthesis